MTDKYKLHSEGDKAICAITQMWWFNSKDLQILYNLIKTLEAKIENGD